MMGKESNKVNKDLFDLQIYLMPTNIGQLMIEPCIMMYKTETGFEIIEASDLGVYPFGFILNMTPEHPLEYGTGIMQLLDAEYDKVYKLEWGLMYLERTSDVLPMPLQFKPLRLYFFEN